MAMNLIFWAAEGAKGFLYHRFTAVTALLGLCLSLWLFAFLLLVWNNLSNYRQSLLEGFRLQVFLETAAGDNGHRQIEDEISNLAGIKEIEYISPEEAARIFSREFGDEIFGIVDDNPLPASIMITLRGDVDPVYKAAQLKREIESLDGVDEVIYQGDILALFESKFKSLIWLLSITGGLILAVSMLIFTQGIRLSIAGRRRFVNTLLLSGAKYSTIRLPFIFEGFLTGSAAGLAAYIGISAVRLVVDQFLFPLPVSGPLYMVIPVGILLGLGGTMVQVRRNLKGFSLDNKGRIY